MEKYKKIFIKRLSVVFLAIIIDQVISDPINEIHPVSHFGKFASWIEKLIYKDSKVHGAIFYLFSLFCPLVALSSLNTFSESVLVGLLLARKTLRLKIKDIEKALRVGDLDKAREILTSLVSREVKNLNATEIIQAAIESLAENTNDAVVAPIFWYLFLGIPGVVIQKTTNTLDSMVGYKTSSYIRFGYFSAKADDVINFLPANLLLIGALIIKPTLVVKLPKILNLARRYPSFNAGVAEASFAALMGIELSKNYSSSLKEIPPAISFGDDPRIDDLGKAIIIADQILLRVLFILLFVVIVK